jgi:hypothetical protein
MAKLDLKPFIIKMADIIVSGEDINQCEWLIHPDNCIKLFDAIPEKFMELKVNPSLYAPINEIFLLNPNKLRFEYP